MAKEIMFYEALFISPYSRILPKEIMFYETLFLSPILTVTIIKLTYGSSI